MTADMLGIAVQAGANFPQALELLRPFIAPFTGARGSVHPISVSDAPDRFPDETLSLLWLAFGRFAKGREFYGMAEVLNRITAANPDLEVDRRLQWLYQRAVRLGE
jgi:hypothetical protein